ncbi:CRYZ, partial [Symbiodinium pilosum]
YVCGAGSGTCATHALCEAAGVFPLPDRVSFAQGACVGVPCATAYYTLKHRAKVREGQSVFIHGASGAVGLAAVQIAKHLGCRVVGTAGTPPGLSAVVAAGADAALNHRESGYLEKCREHAPDGFDVLLEMAAHANLAADLTVAAKRSCICIVGSKAEAVGINPRALMPSEMDIRGVFLGSATAEERAEIHSGLHDLMAGGALAPVVSLQLPLQEAAKAHVEVMQPSAGGAAGNVVLLPFAESSL